jgi:hypothetical protein
MAIIVKLTVNAYHVSWNPARQIIGLAGYLSEALGTSVYHVFPDFSEPIATGIRPLLVIDLNISRASRYSNFDKLCPIAPF